MKRIALPLALVLVLLPFTLNAQAPNVKQFITQIANGWTTEAKRALPDMLVDYPEDPGVMFMHASLVEDPARSLTMFERVVNSHPKSEWADDALFRIIAYSCVKNSVERARKALLTMREQYLQSEYLAAANDLVRMTVGLPPVQDKKVAASPAPATTVTPAVAAAAAAAPAADPSRPFTIQVGSYTSKDQAQSTLDSFKTKRMKAMVVEVARGNWKSFTINVGDYATIDEAKAEVNAVKTICRCKAFVVKR
ncbi:hypothetical protein BH10BAC6_BH10BAC6_05190 [soil metagenome]